MNLIFCHSKKSAKSLKMPKSQISGPFPPIENVSFCKKKFSLSFHTSKTIEKTLGHLILRTFAIFNPTYRPGTLAKRNRPPPATCSRGSLWTWWGEIQWWWQQESPTKISLKLKFAIKRPTPPISPQNLVAKISLEQKVVEYTPCPLSGRILWPESFIHSQLKN